VTIPAGVSLALIRHPSAEVMDHNNELQRRSWRLWRWLYRTRRDRLHKTIVLLEAAVDLTRADWTRTIRAKG
jgi:hypothetical protein